METKNIRQLLVIPKNIIQLRFGMSIDADMEQNKLRSLLSMLKTIEHNKALYIMICKLHYFPETLSYIERSVLTIRTISYDPFGWESIRFA